METHPPGKFILCFIVNCCLCSWKGVGKGLRNRVMLQKDFSVYFQDIFKKIPYNKKTSVAQVTYGKLRDKTQSSFLLKPQYCSCGSALWFMWKRQSLGKCFVLDFCCFHLHLPFCNATGRSKQYPFSEDNVQQWAFSSHMQGTNLVTT